MGTLKRDAELHGRSHDRLFHQCRDRHRADTAGNGCDQRGVLDGVFKIHVSDIALVVSGIDDHSTLFDPVTLNEARLADGGDEDIRSAYDRGQVYRV